MGFFYCKKFFFLSFLYVFMLNVFIRRLEYFNLVSKAFKVDFPWMILKVLTFYHFFFIWNKAHLKANVHILNIFRKKVTKLIRKGFHQTHPFAEAQSSSVSCCVIPLRSQSRYTI